MADLSGTTLGQYHVIAVIGGGGMATVYKAYQPAMARFVAIKVIRTDPATDAEFRRRFQREARIIAGLEHRAIVPVYDVGEDGAIPYLVMRYTPGGTLTALIDQGPLTPGRAVDMIAQVADALAYAHGQGVVHRDIKPANILLSPDGHVLLTDFGIAKLQVETSVMTSPGALVGTPAYMAPEQVRGTAVDARTDIYALGIVLYELLTGQRPFTAETPWAVLDMQVRDPLPPPRMHNPAISEALELVILRATAKDPADRFPSAADFARALRAAMALPDAGGDRLPHPHETVVLEPTVLGRARPRWGWPRIALGLLVCVLVGVASTRILGSAASGPSPTASAISPAGPASTLVFRDSFNDLATSGWGGAAPRWQLARDETGRPVYQGQALPDGPVATAPDGQFDRLTGLADYALSLEFRVTTPGVIGDDFADFWLSARASPDPAATGGCESYVFLVDVGADAVAISRYGTASCGGYIEFTRVATTLTANTWHRLEVTMAGHNLRLSIDGQVVATAQDDRLTHGWFYVTVGNGATVQFADLQVTQHP